LQCVPDRAAREAARFFPALADLNAAAFDVALKNTAHARARRMTALARAQIFLHKRA
jgi:hypothetical protein